MYKKSFPSIRFIKLWIQ